MIRREKELYHDPDNLHPIDEIFVFMSVDAEGNHGICAAILPDLGSTPLMTGSRRGAESMKQMAKDIAKHSNKRIALFRFSRADELWSTTK